MLLLVVLSMLVLFMLIGTAFLMSSSQSRDSAKAMAKVNRVGNNPSDHLYRVLMTLLRDTENPASVVRDHSLLRDFYGTDGFQAVADIGTYARLIASPLDPTQPANDATPLGPTTGQFIDIYVVATPPGSAPTPQNVLKIDRDATGRPQLHVLSLTKGYYNGCLLTITSGPAAGQSARILDYEFVGADPLVKNAVPTTGAVVGTSEGIWRFRVLAFSRADGKPLTVSPASWPTPPTVAELTGANVLVNGRPFNGTGVGYNPLAATGQARLNAVEVFPTSGDEAVGAELALLPNSRYFNPLQGLIGSPRFSITRPFDPGITISEFTPLNDSTVPIFRYPTYAGPGDADEGYDAADFQNMWLALLTVTPRAQGRIVHGDPANPTYLDASDPAVLTDAANFLRLDLEDVPLPSFHRPDLVNFWYHRLVTLLVNDSANPLGPDDAVRAVIQPYVEVNGQLVVNPDASGLSAPQAALVAAIKRKIMMRPIREDHPRFDGSNTQSVPPNLAGRTNLTKNGQIAIPIWEIVGPWDVDNDNDGIAESVWLDFGEPVQGLEDGTRYKVLVAPLIIDLDSKLNVNAHGLVDHINLGQTEFAAVQYPGSNNYVPGPNLAGGAPLSSNVLPQGSGYGPPEISLRPVFPAPIVAASVANRAETTGSPPTEIDDYAAVLAGRVKLDGTAVSGKYGFRSPALAPDQAVTPGLNYDYAAPTPPFAPPTGEQAVPDLTAQIKFFEYPSTYNRLFGYSLYPFAPPGLVPVPPSAFGTPPDLKGRYALGLNYAGQPFYEAEFDQNPNNNFPDALLTDSPYELDLRRSQRREPWSSTGFANPNDDFNKSLVQNDDAPFSPADLERVLRAWDPDSSTLPSRLWDVVSAFDPQQLMNYDAYRVTAISNTMFSRSDQPNDITPEKLATAQQIAGINRRLVTTDSSSAPVPSITPPAFMLQPPMSITDPAIRLRYQIAINRKQPSSLAEILELRIRREAGWPPTAFDDFDPNGDHNLDGEINSIDTEYNQPSAAVAQAARLNRAAQINAVVQQLLAPELLAGKRMDLNRPFGDGRDNAGDGLDNNNNGVFDEPSEPGDAFVNGVVDDPMEAGEPFLDVNGNGKWDGGEPWMELIDRDNDASDNPEYDWPLDQLWQGLTAEPITFDYTNGHAEPVHPAAGVGGVRNLSSQARQLYARHLYCLMLLLVDEGYIAPWDDNDPQIRKLLDTDDSKFESQRETLSKLIAGSATIPAKDSAASQEARRIVLRKLTCRQIAQWAVNCVDMRDADAIMTPFEYDENPWDGWSVLGHDGNAIPIDGDPATDENGDLKPPLPADQVTQVIDWAAMLTNGMQKVTRPVPAPLDARGQTRGLVWGAERPELLITETVALHDRRTEDRGDDPSQMFLNDQPGPPPLDEDLDQRLRPKGSLFVEIYNPWSPTGQYPAELYSRLTRPATGDPAGAVGLETSDGIELGRLSTSGVNSNGFLSNTIEPSNVAKPSVRRSPVFRLIVVEEHPAYRNDANNNKESNFDNQRDPLGTDVHKGTLPSQYNRKVFRPLDPDGPQFDSQYIPDNEPYVERSIYFTSDNSDRWDKGEYKQPLYTDDHVNSRTLLIKKPDDKLVLPPESAKSARYFIAGDVRSVLPTATPDVIKDTDVPIAPIKPGRYALIGTAGAQYLDSDNIATARAIPGEIQGFNGINPISDNMAPRYVTTLSRQYVDQEERETKDARHVGSLLDTTRRIELRPSSNPELQQVLVAGNGGTPLFPLPGPNANEPVQRDNEIVKLPKDPGNGLFHNIFDGDDDGRPDTLIIPPCVAIPVAHMSLSEPLDLYQQRRRDLKNVETPPMDHYWDPLAARGEGMYTRDRTRDNGVVAPYDVPFDDQTRKEFWHNGTTRNYRTVYLQRLADPTLPWNPLPTLPDGKPNKQHNPKLPVNLYRTIDGSSADLTVFNGASSKEPDMDSTLRGDNFWLPTANRPDFEKTYAFPDLPPGSNPPNLNPEHRLSFRSLERGYQDKDAATVGLTVAPRALWRQEPISVFDPKDKSDSPKTTTVLGYAYKTGAAAVAWLNRRFNDLRVRDVGPSASGLKGQFLKDLDAIKTAANNPDGQGIDADFDNFPASLVPKPAHFDIVLKHTLGFQNESFGALETRQDVINQGKPVSALGTPQPDSGFARSAADTSVTPPTPVSVNSTFPWLAWNNRPFVSAGELLNVPGASSSQMLRQYSTIFRTVFNPYDGTGVDTKGTPNPADDVPLAAPARLAAYLSPFGHLLSAFQTASLPAGIAKDATGAPILDANNNWQFVGAPHFYRILDCVHVPSRFVGTETMLTAEVFNDVPGAVDPVTMGGDIAGSQDPRYKFQPPFNKVSRERDPGKVNLNTVIGRRAIDPATGIPRIWSEVFDGIMHRDRDGNPTGQLAHGGPAWRDVALSRRGYFDMNPQPTDRTPDGLLPDVIVSLLNPASPTMFANPFRSPDAGDLVPLDSMKQSGVQATYQRSHPYAPIDPILPLGNGNAGWGTDGVDDNNDSVVDDAREAGVNNDIRSLFTPSKVPLFAENATSSFMDGNRNPAMMYQPMTRLENLVTNRSNVFAIWVTIGYFEVELAPPWSDPAVQARFGGDGNPNSPATIAAQALYNRVYPDGYMLGKEVGSETGDVKRPRGFYIVDRTEEVGFKPGEDLNVEKMIKLRRRIE